MTQPVLRRVLGPEAEKTSPSIFTLLDPSPEKYQQVNTIRVEYSVWTYLRNLLLPLRIKTVVES